MGKKKPHGSFAPGWDENGPNPPVNVPVDLVPYPDVGWNLPPGSTRSAAIHQMWQGKSKVKELPHSVNLIVQGKIYC